MNASTGKNVREMSAFRPWAFLAFGLLALSLAAPGHATPSQALRRYQSGEYLAALEEYQRLLREDPRDPRLNYNAGAAAYKSGDFDYALSQFQAAAASPELDLQQMAFYNMGNTQFRLGEAASKLEARQAQWEQAIQNYEAALALNPNDEDARHNLEWVKKKLEELKRRQQRQQQQSQNNQDQKQDQKQQQNNSEKQQQQRDQQKQQNQQQNQQDNSKSGGQQKDQSPQQREQEQQQQDQPRADQQNEQQQPSQQKQAGQQGESDEQQREDPEAAQAAQFAQLGRMTPQQARQLLDAQKGEEKALIFIPKGTQGDPRERTFKDW